ncbi:phosphatidylinositol glycan anchor biosynthesis class U protein [Caerostris darwini]|uniref:Phosphatidylinositol glycan anchor biosynthesis class U protein n=1 Tax=Caerostris darwini TaxID=1538125 RepID=A0AAV4WD48_9ARAC|nr:phosphatidylinositol glycan anchor biosynthesis class U protein [Caerostris darwini]
MLFQISPALSDTFGYRVEISTPITSWKKAVEGVNLWRQGTNPYDSDIFHESPLGLITYDYLLSHFPDWLPLVFAICDLLTATVLAFVAEQYLYKSIEMEKKQKVPESASSLVLKWSDVNWVPLFVAILYLMSPFSVLSCGGRSTVTFQNCLIAHFMLFTILGCWTFASIILAMLSCHTLYHVTLIVPLAMYIYQTSGNNKTWKIIKVWTSVSTFAVAAATLIMIFRKVTGSWQFLWSTYGCILSVPDLTPNIGLFWYFFTEMFEHFRIFFLCTFQLNVFIYTIPLAVRLRKDPFFFLFIHLFIITIFKSYPCIGDVAFYLALLPIWSHLFYFMKQKFIVCCVMASCTLLAPTLWHLWIYSGSANSNFYFAITLVFNTGQVFLLTDILSAYVKREYYLEKGVKYNEDGTLELMRLQ